MIDAHVHLEKGPYTREWLQEFIFYAQERGIREIYFLEHTHIFRECSSLYSEMSQYNGYQQSWYCKKLEKSRPLTDYLLFADKMRRESFPVKIRIGPVSYTHLDVYKRQGLPSCGRSCAE